MGVWGATIFPGDTASDVGEDYRDAVGNGSVLRRVPEFGIPALLLKLASQAADSPSFCGARSISTLKEHMVSSRLNPK
jgi:hypothetical protein